MGTRQRKALEVSIASEGNQGASPKNHPAPFISTAIERVPKNECQCCAVQDVLDPCRAPTNESLDSQIYQRVNQTPSTNEFPRPIHKQHPKSYNNQRRRVLFHSHKGGKRTSTLFRSRNIVSHPFVQERPLLYRWGPLGVSKGYEARLCKTRGCTTQIA